LYVVLWELEERKSFGWVGVIGARNPSDARKRSREINGIPADSPLVAVALRNWNVTSETAAVGFEDAQATKGKGS